LSCSADDAAAGSLAMLMSATLLAAAHTPHNLSGRLLRPAVRPAAARWLRASAAAGASTAPLLLQRVLDLAARGDLDGTAVAMDELTAEDLGVTTAGLTPGGPVGYHHIYADQDISVGIFVLPAGSAIPLHDHPGMTVLSKVLFGKLKVTSFDRPLPSASPSPPPPKFGGPFTLFGGRGASQQLRCAAPVRHTVVAPCPTLRLDPVRGNIHEFVAVEHTAIFDVLTPPYDDRSGRSCHYYEVEAPGAVLDAQPLDAQPLDAQPLDSVQLREIGWPPSLRVVNRPYRGPQVSPN